MKASGIKKTILGMTFLGFLLLIAGCGPLAVAASSLISFAGGLSLGQAGTPAVQYTCYQNGTPVDCASLPPALQPG